MAEKAISKLLRYIEPILTFADSYIDNEGFIRPIGVIDQNYRTVDDKDLKIPRTYEEWADFKKEESTEIFNPFIVSKHMVFLLELVRRKLNEIYIQFDNIDEEDEESFFDDEELDERLECVRVLKTMPTGLNIITFMYNRNGEDEPVAEGANPDDNLAMWLACANATKTHTRKVPEELMNPDKVVDGMERLLERFQKERKDHMKEEYVMEGINSEDLDESDEEYEAENYPDSYFAECLNIDGQIVDEWGGEEELICMPRFLDPREVIEEEAQAAIVDTIKSALGMEDNSVYDNFDLDSAY